MHETSEIAISGGVCALRAVRARPLDSTSEAKKLSNFLTRRGREGGRLPKMRAGADETPPRIVGEHFDAEEVDLKTNSNQIRR